MNSAALRLVCIMSMVIDHLALVIDGPDWMRWIGRLAFPGFVYLVATGVNRTSSKGRYFWRLVAAGALAQPF